MLEQRGPPLSLATTKNFLHFYISLGKSRIDDKKCIPVNSWNTFSACFVPGFMVKSSINKEGRDAVYDVGSSCSVKECRSC